MLSQRVLVGNQPAAERERGTVQEANVSFDGAQTVRVRLLAKDADFINSASARVIYDPQALQLVEVKSELGSNLQLISGTRVTKPFSCPWEQTCAAFEETCV